jgi:hypothetical protein
MSKPQEGQSIPQTEAKPAQEDLLKKPFEGGSLEGAERAAELKGREKVAAVKKELDSQVQQETAGFQESTSSWWTKAKNAFAGAKSWFTNESAVKGLDDRLATLKSGYQREADAAAAYEVVSLKPVDQLSEAELDAEYEELAQEVAAEGATEGMSAAGERLNQVFMRIQRGKAAAETRKAAPPKPKMPEAAPVVPDADGGQEEAPVTDDMIVEAAPADPERAALEGGLSKARAVHGRVADAERRYVRTLTAKGDAENLAFAAKTYENRAAQYEKMSDEEIVANAVELGAIDKAAAASILKSGRAGEIRAAAVASDRQLAAEARGGAPAEAPAPTAEAPAPTAEATERPSNEAEKATGPETAEEALARMEAGREKLALREAELEGMVEIADDVASGKLKKTDLSAAQMLWMEKTGEVENAREELANVREARQLVSRQIEARQPKVTETTAAAEAAPAAPVEAAPQEPPQAEESAQPEQQDSPQEALHKQQLQEALSKRNIDAKRDEWKQLEGWLQLLSSEIPTEIVDGKLAVSPDQEDTDGWSRDLGKMGREWIGAINSYDTAKRTGASKEALRALEEQITANDFSFRALMNNAREFYMKTRGEVLRKKEDAEAPPSAPKTKPEEKKSAPLRASLGDMLAAKEQRPKKGLKKKSGGPDAGVSASA